MIKLKGWGAVIRDTIMFIIIAVVGFLAVPVVFGSDPSRETLLIFNILLGAIAFCISGCMMAENRWRHLNKVALTVCLIISIVIVATALIPFRYDYRLIVLIIFNILISIIGIYIMMALGGGLSLLFVKSDSKALNKDNK